MLLSAKFTSHYDMADGHRFILLRRDRPISQVRSDLREPSVRSDLAGTDFRRLQRALEAGRAMSSKMKEAFYKATSEARNMNELREEFAKERPVVAGVLCAVVALGTLYVVSPEIISSLGFTAQGPAAGKSNASRVECSRGILTDRDRRRIFCGTVAIIGVWCSRSDWLGLAYLQSLGMTWNGGLVPVVLVSSVL